MNKVLFGIQHSPIQDYDFSGHFAQIPYNGAILSEKERDNLITIIDETVLHYSSGLPLIQEALEENSKYKDDLHQLSNIVDSMMLFVLLTANDILVSSKYFLIADKDYDKRFFRGKMKVILNEGFKQLFGFNKETRKKSEWNRLKPYMPNFPKLIQNQYSKLTEKLENHANSFDWWRDDRNIETHIDEEKLYLSRQEEIIESKVMMDSLKLFNSLLAVNLFLSNVDACILNTIIDNCTAKR